MSISRHLEIHPTIKYFTKYFHLNTNSKPNTTAKIKQEAIQP